MKHKKLTKYLLALPILYLGTMTYLFLLSIFDTFLYICFIPIVAISFAKLYLFLCNKVEAKK